MLTRDQEFFDRNFTSAAAFIRAANLRKELYALALNYETLTEWEVSRIHDLIKAPACREQWFIDQLCNDCKGRVGREQGRFPRPPKRNWIIEMLEKI